MQKKKTNILVCVKFRLLWQNLFKTNKKIEEQTKTQVNSMFFFFREENIALMISLDHTTVRIKKKTYMSVDGVKIFYLVKDRKKNVIFGEKFQKKISVAIGCCSFSVQNLSNLQNLQNYHNAPTVTYDILF